MYDERRIYTLGEGEEGKEWEYRIHGELACCLHMNLSISSGNVKRHVDSTLNITTTTTTTTTATTKAHR